MQYNNKHKPKSMFSKKKCFSLIIALVAFLGIIGYYHQIPIKYVYFKQTNAKFQTNINEITGDIIDFEGFNNQNGTHHLIIPNIVHLLYLQQPYIKFYQLVNIFSILLNHKPAQILIHCDKCNFTGKYWNIIKNTPELWEIIKINKIPFKTTIFGVKYGWINYHRSDVWRLLILMNYGGIYLDNDVYVVNSLDKYRKYEMVVSWDSDDSALGVQVLIAHRNARLLKAHFDAYRYNYTPSQWYWNAGHVPAKILLKNRGLAHIVKKKLGTHMLIHDLFKTFWSSWKDLDTIHLLINHRTYLDKQSPIKEFDEINIKKYKYTYGFMVRDILDRQGLFKT